MTAEIINLEHVIARKELGMAPDTPIIDKFYSKRGTKHQMKIAKCFAEVAKFNDRELSAVEFAAFFGKFHKLKLAVNRLALYADELERKKDTEAVAHRAWLQRFIMPSVLQIQEQIESELFG